MLETLPSLSGTVALGEAAVCFALGLSLLRVCRRFPEQFRQD